MGIVSEGGVSCTSIPCIERLVCLSTSLPLAISTRRPKWCRKSAPRRGFCTSAMINIQRKVLCKPRLSINERVPYHGRYCCPIDCRESETFLLPETVGASRQYDTYLCTSIYETWPSEAGRQGLLEPPHFLCLPFQRHIIMAYERTRMRTIGMQTTHKTAGTDSVSSSI